jgi:phosphatidate cytidylyltransferase
MAETHDRSESQIKQSAAAADRSELKNRVVSALGLGLTGMLAVWLGPIPFTILVGAVGLIMSWEWGRVVRGHDVDIAFAVHAATVVAVTGLTGAKLLAPAFAVLVAGSIAVFVVQWRLRPFLSLLGVVYVGLPAMALVWLRNDAHYGLWAIVFIFAVVAAHDTFAMLVGKAIRGPRLWPSLSPNKTWAGLVGGLAASAILGCLFSVMLGNGRPIATGLVALGLGLAAFAGDLLESALKRRYGVKNASNLIPGHGGFMDRMDGAVLAAIAAVAIALSVNSASPAAGLLFLQ